MQLLKRCAALLMALLLSSVSITAYAHEVPDTTKKGFITVTMTYENKAVPGGTLTLYRVGAVAEDDGNYSFALTGAFTGSGFSLEDIQSAQLAKDLAAYVGDHKLPGTTKEIESTGKVSFSDLELGLYLLVQTEAASGYSKAEPFLVSVPLNEDGAYRYHVDASPKVELKKESMPTTPPTPSSPTLPQTGQLNWPIPVLAVLGLLLFSAGWMLRFGGKRGGNEK